MSEEYEDLLKEPSRLTVLWWRVCWFVKDWVYPAYSLRNFLFNRHDIVRLRDVKRGEYCDVAERLFLANMELIRFFIEEERPEKHVCWYRDEEGNDVGHKYGENKEFYPCLFPEYDGVYIMDIIKEIYNWWRFDYPRLSNERDYLLHFCCEYVFGKLKSRKTTEEFSDVVFDRSECPKTLAELPEDVDWVILYQYCDGDRSNVLDEDFMRSALRRAEDEIERQKQKYLHLCIEVRPYLWT